MIQNVIYFLVAAIGFSACKTEKVALQEGVSLLKYKQSVTLDPGTQTLATFSEVQDGRCPENVNCIWSGSVTVDLILNIQSQKKQQDVKLCLFCIVGQDGTKVQPNADVDLNGEKYRILLQSVTPSPNTEIPRKKEDYIISIKIDKI